MPGGGNWTVQNKRRPGAYINFVSVPKPVGAIGSRGTVICALPMTWGASDKLITLYGSDLLDGKSEAKVGCTAFDTEESLPYRLALSNSYKALLYRSDVGGVKATASLAAGSLSVSAKYAGTTGNQIKIVTIEDKPEVGKYTAQVLFKGIVKETFIVTNVTNFAELESAWVDFIVSDPPSSNEVPVTAGVTLSAGTNGTVGTNYADFFDKANMDQWQCLAINSSDPSVASAIIAFIKMMREQKGKKVQGVVYDNPSADYEGIISVNQGFTTLVDSVPADLFPLWAASVTAGANINVSNTAKVVDQAVSIINPVDDSDIEDALTVGKFILTYRQDGAVCVEQDINTLTTFTVDKNYVFSKNRVIRCLDEIGNSVALTFNRNYSGKISNNSVGRNLYKTEIIALLDTLQAIEAIQNFEGAADVTVLPGESIDGVVVDVAVQPVDSMEKLYMTVNVDA